MRKAALGIMTAVAMLFAPSPGRADGEPAGAFDYYVLALSWSPSWCAREGAARSAEQCAPDRDHGFILHGLWPQYEDGGWPAFCPTARRDPSRAETRDMADVMGSAGLAWYQWKKHGRCTGMTATAYFETARAALSRVRIPDVFSRIDRTLSVPPHVVEEAFLRANPGLDASMITVTCKEGRIDEVRICLTRELTPRRCTGNVARDCALDRAILPAIP